MISLSDPDMTLTLPKLLLAVLGLSALLAMIAIVLIRIPDDTQASLSEVGSSRQDAGADGQVRDRDDGRDRRGL